MTQLMGFSCEKGLVLSLPRLWDVDAQGLPLEWPGL